MLVISIKGKKEADKIKKAPKLSEAVNMIAKLGGFLGRKSDGPPGMKSIWLGMRSLEEKHELYLQLFCG